MKIIKNAFDKFNNSDITIKVSIILLIIIVFLGIFQGVSLLRDNSKQDVTDENIITKNNVISDNTNKSTSNGINNANANSKTGTQSSYTQGNNNIAQNQQTTNSITPTYVPNNLPIVLIFTSEGLDSADEKYSQMDSKIKWLETNYKGKLIVRNETLELNNDDVKKYNITFFPISVMLNSKGEEIGRFEGDWSEEQITDQLNELGIQ